MVRTQRLVEVATRNGWIIKAQTEGLSHEHSLLQPPFRGNCMNWVLGHIVENRDRVLPALGQEGVVGEEIGALYRRSSGPVVGGEGAATLPELLMLLNEQEERLTAALAEASAELLEEEADPERGITVGDRIEYLLWHETYHVGQLEYLRQLAGTDDAVIE